MSIEKTVQTTGLNPPGLTLRYPLSTSHTVGQFIGRACLGVVGWKIVGKLPDVPKYVLVGAPHTSNWDFLLTLALKAATGENLQFIGKDSLFHGIPGYLMRKLGGIPVNRRERSGFVNAMIELFQNQEKLIIAIAPEGTRGKSTYWKSGFYYMAAGAGVPIQLAGINYQVKQIEIGPLLTPSGDFQADMDVIRMFYQDKRGKYPSKQGKIEIIETAGKLE